MYHNLHRELFDLLMIYSEKELMINYYIFQIFMIPRIFLQNCHCKYEKTFKFITYYLFNLGYINIINETI